MDRRWRMLGDIDFGQSLGIEIGALHSPTVITAEGRVLYVDYAPTDALRAGLQHPGVRPEDVLEVDIVWAGPGDGSLRDLIGEPADFIVASHVIEHVPDLAGWLLALHAALKPGGVLGLAVPDRRFTFDGYRPDSLIGEIAEAYIQGHTRPTLRQIFESSAFSRGSQDEADWRPDAGAGGLPREVLARLPGVYQWMKNEDGQSPSLDVHCWVFTPASFLAAAEALAAIGCFPFAIEAFFPTETGEIDFHVRLRARADQKAPGIQASIAAARRTLGQAPQAAATPAAALATLRASTSWRVTAPLRALGRMLK